MSHDDRLARIETSLRRIERRQIRAERHLRWLRVLGLASIGRSEEILVLLRALTPSDPLAAAKVADLPRWNWLGGGALFVTLSLFFSVS